VRWHIYLIAVWVSIFAVPQLRAAPTNQDMYLNIIYGIHDAEQMEESGDFQGALDKYKDCNAKLLKIHNATPDWETAMVLARLRDFKEKITELQAKVAKMPPPAPPPTPPSPPPSSDTNTPPNSATPATNAPPVAPNTDTVTVQQQLEIVKHALDDMTKNYQDSQGQVQTLQSQLKATKDELAVAKSQQSADTNVNDLLAKNKELTDKLADAQKQLQDLKSPQATTLLRAKLKNTQDQLEAAQASNAALRQTTDTLKAQYQQAQSDLAIANQKLAATSPNSPEYATIKRENEIMRGILTRELQEQAHRDMAKRLAQEEFDRLKITSIKLQEQLDILSSPMTPPANDDERDLLRSLKGPGMEAVPATNALTATKDSSMPPSTDTAPATTVVTPTPSPSDTNTPPVVVVESNNPALPSMSDTNSAPATTDTNAPPMTNTPPTVPADTGTPPSTDTNAPTVTPTPPIKTVIQDTTIQNNPPQKPDATQYSTSPRLPEDMRDTAQQAADLFKMQRYDEAADKYQSIIDKYPESLYAWSNLGVVRFQQGKLNEALRALQQAVKLSPTDAFSYMNLGIVYYQLNQFENAMDALERALALDPNNAKAHNYLGCACSQKGWQEVAEKEFRKAIDIDETFGDAHFNLALVYATSKPPSLELARRHYKRALELGIAKDPKLEKILQM